ncbi:unnamed protein product [Protopolystoma xenopodis]|uniref:Uncharacterized protein n=1 Tax=Protopolystoma xenopodis TaxID=117903 RepID=A0A3S5B8L9_9PLAT|nr:unnamed protein product [Protopolystoma xenopodis]
MEAELRVSAAADQEPGKVVPFRVRHSPPVGKVKSKEKNEEKRRWPVGKGSGPSMGPSYRLKSVDFSNQVEINASRKASSAGTFANDLLICWERATSLVLAREANFAKLAMFEKDASDPNRFFQSASSAGTFANGLLICWERATSLVLAREANFAKLAMFEKDASDPNRFFQSG